MGIRFEVDTITSSLEESSRRITTLVESSGGLAGDLYVELVAIERTMGTLVRRLERLRGRLSEH